MGIAIVYVLRGQRKLAATAALVVAAVVIVPALPQEFWDRMSTIAMPNNLREDDISSRGRLYFWEVAMDMANDSPLVGIGHNTFNANYNRFDKTNGQYGFDRSVHSAWFGVLAEDGYPGLLLFITILALAFRACARARKAARVGPEYENLRKFAFAIETALVAFCVGGTFLPFQYTEMLWHVIGLSIALDGLARAALSTAIVPAPSVRDFGSPQVAVAALAS
jgi:O-antigen ligase